MSAIGGTHDLAGEAIPAEQAGESRDSLGAGGYPVIARRRQPIGGTMTTATSSVPTQSNTALTGATYDIDGGRQFVS
jgi:hypothetical protein